MTVKPKPVAKGTTKALYQRIRSDIEGPGLPALAGGRCDPCIVGLGEQQLIPCRVQRLCRVGRAPQSVGKGCHLLGDNDLVFGAAHLLSNRPQGGISPGQRD